MATTTPEATFLKTALSHLPDEIRTQLAPLLSSEATVQILENFTRFLSGAAPPPSASPAVHGSWAQKQRTLTEALNALRGAASGTKRALEDTGAGDAASGHNPKRQRVSEESTRYRLHGISVTSPIRKKVDIIVTDESIVLANPATAAVEATVPRASITRAFILPTRGKTKSHYTVVMLDADVVRPAKGRTAAQASAQVIFGLDAQAPANTRVTPAAGPTATLDKGAPVHAYLRAFLAAAGAPVYEPSGATLKSAATTSAGASASADGIPGVEAYRGAKPGTLWFFEEGLLWGESKPCEFWAVGDLLGAADGVRLLSATGRTCSVTLTRRSADVDEDGEDLGEETQLSMIDGREQDGISQWVRKHRHLFGRSAEDVAREGQGGALPKPAAPAGPITIHQLAAESDDESDEDFHGSSSDEGSGSESGGEEVEGSEDAEGEDDEGEAASSDEEMVDGDGDEDNDMELDEQHHPLLRPGAMPKMSRAAMDAVVGMVEHDIFGGDDGADNDEGEEEEDELDD
ncbi:histone chaperone Rttp106-like-domain-containing protein [Schizophyllum fasciatum]